MKRILWSLLLASPLALAGNVDISAKNALVIDTSNNQVLFEKNSTDVKPVASITKLMTSIVILSSNLDMNEQITITDEDVGHTVLNGVKMRNHIPVGMTLTRAELMHFMLMNSANIAAAALARTYPGGYDTFIRTMNAEADVLGMTKTHFVDSCGLSSDNVSTAHDLYLLVRTAGAYPMIQDFSTSETFEATGYYRNLNKTVALHTTNRLVTSNDWSIDVQKTGFTNAAGRCMVLLANAGEKKVVIIVLDSSTTLHRLRDATTLKYVAMDETPPVFKEVRVVKKHKHKRKKSIRA
jgi:D-alanyl-D-alanine endopeptidase (penicillin-binding protein 7)